jgi:ATP-dependent Clp protease ATP-binding subunit ClpA
VLAVASAMDAANILKPALARGEALLVQPPDEYQKYFEKTKHSKDVSKIIIEEQIPKVRFQSFVVSRKI